MINKKRNFILNIIGGILIFILMSSFWIFSYYLGKLNILPAKYLIGGVIGIVIVILILMFLLFRKKANVLKAIAVVIVFILAILFNKGTIYLANTYDFLASTNKDYDTLTYAVMVLDNNSYNKIEDLKDKNILYYDDEYKVEIKKELESKISYQESLSNEVGNILDKLLSLEVDAIVLEENTLELLKEERTLEEVRLKTIYTFSLEVKAHIEKTEEIIVDSSLGNKTISNAGNKDVLILYISGIDQYGDVVSARGRSDVNQLVIVNLKTNHILLLNTPRDYYVQLAGTSGLRDKLTHAGIYGVNKSIQTLENLYNIDINHYVRVNFNTLIKVVDVIGGIDVNSDQAFRAYTNGNVYVNEGWNHFNGTAALAYSRERYAYTTGDNHRGANQQQVIAAILDKLTTSSVLISKYNSILETLRGSFQTDMSISEITSFIRYQIDKMPKWKIDSYAVVGVGSKNYTYSMGMNYLLYVMEPNMSSVNTAKEKIRGVLNET